MVDDPLINQSPTHMDYRDRQRGPILGSGAKDFSEERHRLLGIWYTLRDQLEALEDLITEAEDMAFELLDTLEDEQQKAIPARIVG